MERLFMLDFLERRGWSLVSASHMVFEFSKPCGHCLSISNVRGYEFYALYINRPGVLPVTVVGK